MLSSTNEQQVILVVGSCGLDRILMVPTYPVSDSKIRSTSFHEIGGGNAANTAAAMALLSTASFLSSSRQSRAGDVTVKLCTKIGDDYIGNHVMEELEKSGVDLSSPLFQVVQESSTGFATVIVSTEEQTRTCIHTPGTCGELTAADCQVVDMDTVFRNVVHVHSDSRHTEAALILAREARRRGISVSLDVEKDRDTKALDALLDEATIVFTNSDQIDGYLDRLMNELEEGSPMKHSLAQQEPIVEVASEEEGEHKSPISSSLSLSDADAHLFAHAIRPSTYLTRWYRHAIKKEVIITKGSRGALHVTCDGFSIVNDSLQSGSVTNTIRVTVMDAIDGGSNRVKVQHLFSEHTDESGGTKNSGHGSCRRLCSAELSIQHAGVLSGVHVVDTTGAGDAFIGGYVLANLADIGLPDVDSRLRFGCWVGGRKLEGPGARTALPNGFQDVDKMLGKDVTQIQEALGKIIGPFQS